MPQIASYLTPPQVAERFAVDPHKVLDWIRRGELHAIDCATVTGGRPRYRVSQKALEQFELHRSATPQPRITRCRRRKDPNIVEFFL